MSMKNEYNEQLKHLISHAEKNSPYYKLFLNGFSELETAEFNQNFKKLPFLSRQDVNNYKNHLFTSVGDKRLLNVKKTSGTTGEPAEIVVPRFFDTV